MTVDESKTLTLGSIILDSEYLDIFQMVTSISIDRIIVKTTGLGYELTWVRTGLYSHNLVSKIFEGEL